jgi:hypothetical protein
MKIRFIPLSFLAIVSFAAPLAADTFTLKDGTVLEGKVLRTEGDVLVIEYQVTKSIKDIRRVPKSQIAKVAEIKLDDKAFEAISKLVPTPDLLTAEDYEQRITAVKGFLAKYPKGAKAKEAEAMLKKLTEEAAVVEAGGRKFEGSMMPAADYRANAYDLDAKVQEMKIQTAVKNSQWLAALRAFAELDKDFQGSASFRASIPAVLKALQAFRTQINSSLSTYDTRMEKQAADLEAMASGDRTATKEALAEEATKLEARYQAEKAAQQVWVTPSSSHKQSLEDCSSLAESEIQRLTSPIEAGAGDPGKAYRNAWKVLRGEPDAEAVEKVMSEADAAGLPEKYKKMLEDAAKASGAIKADEP